MSTDVLSEVLRAVRLKGAVFFTVEGFSPWVAEAPAACVVAPYVMPGAEHVIEYHVVSQGTCYGGLVDGASVQLNAGDVIVFPHGDAHIMSSAPGMRGSQDLALFRAAGSRPLPITLKSSDEGPKSTEVICGFIGCDARPFNPLLATLPQVLHLRRDSAMNRGLLEHLVQVALFESRSPKAGGETMLARLSELLFIEVVRSYCAEMPAETRGWLAGLRDEVTGRALSFLHDQPAAAWSLEKLAKEVGLSRSVLAERFHEYVGTPPMQYLARWRMQLAASLLGGSTLSLMQVADSVGYGSEAAFSRAFKRLVGVAPSAWREGERAGADFVAEV